MNGPMPHVTDDLQLHLDGRLDPSAAARVDEHLAACAECRRAAEELRAVKSAVGTLRREAAPAGLADQVRAALDAEGTRGPRRWPVALGLAAAAVLAVAIWLWPGETVPESAAAGTAAVEDGRLALEWTTADPGDLERRFASRGLPVRVLDLAMMDLALEGGAIRQLAGRPAALYVYRRPDGVRVVCQMFAGALDELPPAARTLERDGFTFLVYRDGPRTLVFWAEGDILCVLASDLPEAEVIALAQGKAMKPA